MSSRRSIQLPGRARRAILALLAAGISATTLGGPPALAGTPGPSESLGRSKGIEYVRATFPQVASQTSQTAACGDGRSAMAGGGAIGGPGTTSRLNESYPSTLAGGWTVEGSTDGVDARDMSTFAVCTKRLVSLVEGAPTLAGQDGGEPNFAVECDTGKATGGGVSADMPGLQTLGSSPYFFEPPENIWRSTILNPTQQDALVTPSATCSSGYRVRYRRAERVRVRTGKDGSAVARCRSDEVVVGGGYLSSAIVTSGALSLLRSQPIDAKRERGRVPDDGWRIRVHGIEGSSLFVEAVCAKPLG